MSRKRVFEDDVEQVEEKTEYSAYPGFDVSNLRAKKPSLDVPCISHPIEPSKYLSFAPDPDTVNSDKIVRRYTFSSTDNTDEQRAQLMSIPAGAYNYILFADAVARKFTLFMVWMNPLEYHTKHNQLMYDSKHIDQNRFLYSGEILFNGTPDLEAADISSLYFANIKADSILFAFKTLFPVIEDVLGPRGITHYNGIKGNLTPKVEKDAINMYYNRGATYNFLKPNIRDQIDNTLQYMFLRMMKYALSTIFGPVTVIYNEAIYANSNQTKVTAEFMNLLCSVKPATEYPPLYSDNYCSNVLPGETWCTPSIA